MSNKKKDEGWILWIFIGIFFLVIIGGTQDNGKADKKTGERKEYELEIYQNDKHIGYAKNFTTSQSGCIYVFDKNGTKKGRVCGQFFIKSE